MHMPSRHGLFEALQAAESAGLPPAQALSLLPARGGADQVLALTAVQKLLKADTPLSEAARRCGLFEPGEIGLIRIGERLGRLPEMHAWLAGHYRLLGGRWQDAHDRLRLPLLVWLAAALFLKLPALVGGKLGFGAWLLQVSLPAALLLAGLALCRSHGGRTLPAGLSRLLGALPGIGAHLRQYHEAVFCHYLGLALEAGLPLPEAAALAAEGVGNPALRDRFDTLADALAAGSDLGEALAFSQALPAPQALGRLVSAEATGTLPATLQEMARQLTRGNQAAWDRGLRYAVYAAWALVLLPLLPY